MRLKSAAIALGLLAAVGGLGISTAGALEPGDVCVLYNTKSADSQILANYYMEARKIPKENLIPVICAVAEETTESEYRRTILPQVQKALAAHPNVKCLVTMYDMPLKIGAVQSTLPERQEINGFKMQLETVMDEMEKAIGDYGRVGNPEAAPASQPATAPANVKRNWQDLVGKLNDAANAAGERVNKTDEAHRGPVALEFLKVQEHVAGLTGLLKVFQAQANSPNADAMHAEQEKLQTKLRDLNLLATELVKQRDNPASRKQIVGVKLASEGLVGQAREIDGILKYIEPIETESSFDNELALVLAEQNYPRSHWLANPENVAFYAQFQHGPKPPRTLLVCRLDSDTAADVHKMIDTEIAVEKKGLDGKIYLDARDIHGGGYGAFDDELREAAAWLKAHSTMECVLDNKPELFKKEDCPDAALYCGWYSVRNFKDTCQWVPGGVGYHVASFEMMTLHQPNEPGWVVNLLKKGYCGTLGPTAEPYLSSFPNPAHFFPLLLSGEFTQGEVWEVTAPMVSWRTAYVGDPLYNPFKAKPRVKIETLKEDPVMRNAFVILRPAEKLPSGTMPVAPVPDGAR